MLSKYGTLAIAALVVSTAAFGTDSPGDLTEKHRQLIREGIALHEQGKFDAAIEKYKAVLAEDPANVNALYEAGYASMMKGDAQWCIRYATAGLKQPSNLEGDLYSTLGSCQDIAGDRRAAIDTLKKGIKRAPDHSMLYFNLGITYRNAEKLKEAREALRKSLERQPRHPGSHLALAQVYIQQGYRIPALMAALTFLSYEPHSPRSPAGLQIVQQCLGGLVTERGNGKDVNITLTANAPTDEGDFTPAEMMLAMGLAPVGKNEKESDFERLSGAISVLSSTLANLSCKSGAFACRHYAPFFAAASSGELSHALVYRAVSAAAVKGKDEWGAANADKIQAFEKLLGDYNWPGKR